MSGFQEVSNLNSSSSGTSLGYIDSNCTARLVPSISKEISEIAKSTHKIHSMNTVKEYNKVFSQKQEISQSAVQSPCTQFSPQSFSPQHFSPSTRWFFHNVFKKWFIGNKIAISYIDWKGLQVIFGHFMVIQWKFLETQPSHFHVK